MKTRSGETRKRIKGTPIHAHIAGRSPAIDASSANTAAAAKQRSGLHLAHLCVRGRETDDRLKAPRGHRQGPLVLPAPHLGVPARYELAGSLGQHRLDPGLGKVQVLPEEVMLEEVVGVRVGVLGRLELAELARRGPVPSLPHRVGPGSAARRPRTSSLVVGVAVVVVVAVVAGGTVPGPVPVAPDDVGRDAPVVAWVHLVQHHEEQIEPREQRVREADVLLDAALAIVLAVDRVGRRQDGAAGVEAGVNSSLGDGNGLLLHGLVDGHPVILAHLVELVDAYQSAVGQDHGPGL